MLSGDFSMSNINRPESVDLDPPPPKERKKGKGGNDDLDDLLIKNMEHK